jgi:hypothetical protein
LGGRWNVEVPGNAESAHTAVGADSMPDETVDLVGGDSGGTKTVTCATPLPLAVRLPNRGRVPPAHTPTLLRRRGVAPGRRVGAEGQGRTRTSKPCASHPRRTLWGLRV